MKRLLLAAAALLTLSLSVASAQELLRSHFSFKGYNYISAELEKVPCDHPFYLRLERVGFPDNTYAYLMHINFEDKVSYEIPRGAKMAFTTSDGKIVRAEQIGQGGGEHRAFTNADGKRVYWNSGQYMITEDELVKLLSGVKSIDVITGWDPDDYFQTAFKNDELGKALARQYEVIQDVKGEAVEVQQEDIVNYSDNNNSLTVLTQAHVAQGDKMPYNVSVNYLYYKDSNTEDFDINFMLGTEDQYLIPIDSKVTITLEDGSVMTLQQQRDAYNTVYLYPTPQQTKALRSGVKGLSVETEKGTLTDSFSGDGFSAVINRLYNTLMAVAAL